MAGALIEGGRLGDETRRPVTGRGSSHEHALSFPLKAQLAGQIQNRAYGTVCKESLDFQPVAEFKARQVALELLNRQPDELALKRSGLL